MRLFEEDEGRFAFCMDEDNYPVYPHPDVLNSLVSKFWKMVVDLMSMFREYLK